MNYLTPIIKKNIRFSINMTYGFISSNNSKL